MCYYTAYVYTVCGHVTISEFPVQNSPCSKRLLVHGSSQRPKSLPPDTSRLAESIERPLSVIPAVTPPPSEAKPPSDCDEKLVHAMHTLSIERLCASCITEREARFALFQTRMRDDMGQRISTRLTSINNGAGWRGRQFRATSASPPRPMSTMASVGLSEAGDEAPLTAVAPATRRPSVAGSDMTDVSVASSSAVSVQEAVGNFMRGVKGGWNVPDGRSLFSPPFSSTGRKSIFASPVSPRSRTPAGAIAAATAAGQPIDSQILLPLNSGDGRVMLSFGGLGD
jgi:hypothetical protein